MKKLVFILAALVVALSAGAQSMKTYYLVLPQNADTTVDKIFVADFTKSDPLAETVFANFGSNLADDIKDEIRASERYGNVEYIPPSWLRSDIYEVAKDKSKADWVLTGEYSLKTDQKRDKSTSVKKEKADPENTYILPYEVIEYDYSNSLEVEVSFELKDKSGQEIAANAWKDSYASNPKKSTIDPTPKLKSHRSLAASARGDFVPAIANSFLPFFKSLNYNFLKIKNRDIKKSGVSRDRYKELRKMKRDENSMAKDKDYYGLGALYKTIAEDTGLKEAKWNMGMVYEVLGNYTRAREIYKEIDNTKGLERLEIFINTRKMLKGFGKDYFEPEL